MKYLMSYYIEHQTPKLLLLLSPIALQISIQTVYISHTFYLDFFLSFYLPIGWGSSDINSSLLNSEISLCHSLKHSETPDSNLIFVSSNIPY